MAERLDRALLEELELLMEGDFCALLETYLRDSQARYFEVAEAWEGGDLELLRRSAHSLKGASGNIGAAHLAALCGDLERLARDGCRDGLPGLLERLRLELQEVREAVEALCAAR